MEMFPDILNIPNRDNTEQHFNIHTDHQVNMMDGVEGDKYRVR
jgi:hypothetical protein